MFVDERAKQVLQIGPQVAEHLPGWKFWKGENEWQTYLIPSNVKVPKPCDGGFTIHLSIDHKGRLHVSGEWPRSKKTGSVYNPRDYLAPDREESAYEPISCSADKGPKKIAADIQRRFLPGYERAYKACVERMQKDEAAKDDQQKAIEEFSKLLGERPRDARSESVHFYFKGLYGDVQVHHGGDSCKLGLSCNTEQAMIALKALKAAGAFRKAE